MVFEVLNKDNLMARVTMDEGEPVIEVFSDDIMCPFGGGDLGRWRVMEFLESRCFDVKRPDRDEMLERMGLTVYDPLEIVKVTHGRMWNDFTWIRFEGENLVWKDIALRE